MAIYRNKPVGVEAFKFIYDEFQDWADEAIDKGEIEITYDDGGVCSKNIIKTLEGNIVGGYSDYIIKSVKGELYTRKAHIFERNYEIVK